MTRRAIQHFSDEQLAYGKTLTAAQILQFLEDFRLLHAGNDRTQANPENTHRPDTKPTY